MPHQLPCSRPLALFLAVFGAIPLPANARQLERGGARIVFQGAPYTVNHLGAGLGYGATLPGKDPGEFLVLMNEEKTGFPVSLSLAEVRWAKFLRHERELGAESDDLGCERTAGGFTCARTARLETGKQIAEKHVWLGEQVMVTVRVSLLGEAAEAQRTLASFHVETAKQNGARHEK